MCRDGWLGCPSSRYAREAPALRRGFFYAHSARAHPVQLEHGIDGVARGSRNAQLAPEDADLAGQPVELEPVAAFEIVRHRRLHAGFDLAGKEIHALLEIGGI